MDPKIITIIAVSYGYGFFEVLMNLREICPPHKMA